jgi:GTPase SAR1 family protein
MHAPKGSSIDISEADEITFTVLIVGNKRVGKTSLIQRYLEQNCNGIYFPTIGNF